MHLAALKIGSGVSTEPFTGVVRSVFTNATILVVGNGLVTLVPVSAGGLPSAVSIEVPLGFDFTGLLAAGTAVASRAGILRFADSPASVDLRMARRWSSSLRSIRLDFARPGTDRAWRRVAAALQADGRSHVIARLAGAAIVSLSQTTRDFDLASAVLAAGRLVGLGAGATPAGDDLLVGYLAGLWSSIADDRDRADFAGGLSEAIGGLANRTSDVSRVYLRAAAACEESERLASVIIGIAAGAAPAAVGEAAACAMAVGHSSGADTTLGLLLGLAVWGPEPILAASRRFVGERTPAARINS